MSATNHLDVIRDFLDQRRIALVGLSHDPKHFSHAVYRELAGRDCQVVPVNPAHAGEEIEGQPAYASVGAIPGKVDGALIMTKAEHAADAVRDCLDAQVGRVWLYRGGGPGAVSEEAVKLLQDAHVDYVAGECPMMFLDHAHWVHRLHGWACKVTGSYPA